MLDAFTRERSKEYDKWHSIVHGQENRNETHLCNWHLDALSLISQVDGLKILEVGCGAGDFAIYLAKQGANVTAVDFSCSAIEIAREKANVQGSKVDFQIADAQILPFKKNSFDIIFSCECLEHIPDPRKGLSEMHRVLKPLGRLILTTENYSNGMLISWLYSWIFRKPFNSGAGVQPIEHFFLYWNVMKKFRKENFKIIRMIGAHHVFFLLPKMHPHTFVVEKFKSTLFANIFKPFARHVAFEAVKLSDDKQ